MDYLLFIVFSIIGIVIIIKPIFLINFNNNHIVGKHFPISDSKGNLLWTRIIGVIFILSSAFICFY